MFIEKGVRGVMRAHHVATLPSHNNPPLTTPHSPLVHITLLSHVLMQGGLTRAYFDRLIEQKVVCFETGKLFRSSLSIIKFTGSSRTHVVVIGWSQSKNNPILSMIYIINLYQIRIFWIEWDQLVLGANHFFLELSEQTILLATLRRIEWNRQQVD